MPPDPRPLPELVSFLETFPEPHILCDRDYRILAANAAYRRSWPEARSVIGRTCYDVSHHYSVPCDRAGESCPLARSLQSGQRERVLHLHHTPRGEEYVDIELSPVRDAAGEIAWFIEKMEPLHVARGVSDRRGLIGRSPAFQRMLELIARVAPSDASVLLQGESGTGKELLARALHYGSPRESGAFVVENCGALPDTLLESELFGARRGAYTGATEDREGLFRQASGGSILLDEIGETSPAFQVKLLRVLQEGEVRPVGAPRPVPVDVRVIAATNRDLEAEVRAGRFREDLYYRLNVITVELPPLRERAEDVPLLVERFLSEIAETTKTPPKTITDEAMALLERYPWPGNVRELRNEIHKAHALSDKVILPMVLSDPVRKAVAEPVPVPMLGKKTLKEMVREVADDLERRAILEALRRTRGRKAQAARLLGVSRPTLDAKLEQLGVDVPRTTGGPLTD